MLLFLMIGAGVTSASLGYKMGRDALKGITQPDTRPVSNVSDAQGKPLRREGKLALLKEQDIITNVKARIGGGKTEAASDKAGSGTAAPKASPSPAEKTSGLPLSVENRAVKLEVTGVAKQGNNLVLDVNLLNNSSKAVQFLYSSLEVTNDQGRLLTAETQGLPEELAPNGKAAPGKISIPTDLLDNAKSLSLTLTDYPEQQVQLKLSGIPVEQ
jgi:hypothetical protein